MILVTTGTQKFPFNRLLKAVDKEIKAGVITEDVFAYHLQFRQLQVQHSVLCLICKIIKTGVIP